MFLAVTDLLPGIMQQLGAENMFNLKALAQQLAASGNLKPSDLSAGANAGDDDVPELVENFDEASKDEK